MGECRDCSKQWDGFEITLGKIIRFPSVLLEDRKGALPLSHFLFCRAEREEEANLSCDIIFEECWNKGRNDPLGTVLSLGMFFSCAWGKVGSWSSQAGLCVWVWKLILSVCVDVLLMRSIWNQKALSPIVRKRREKKKIKVTFSSWVSHGVGSQHGSL